MLIEWEISCEMLSLFWNGRVCCRHRTACEMCASEQGTIVLPNCHTLVRTFHLNERYNNIYIKIVLLFYHIEWKWEEQKQRMLSAWRESEQKKKNVTYDALKEP